MIRGCGNLILQPDGIQRKHPNGVSFIAKKLIFISTMFCAAVSQNPADAANYYVATNGLDTNAGTSTNLPLKTIKKAVKMLAAGDTCYIRGGTYREEVTLTASGTNGAPIRFQNYSNETVVLDGADTTNLSWSVYTGNVYVANTGGLNLTDLTQVFLGTQMMQIARWPNSKFPDDLWNVTNRWAATTTGSALGKIVDSGGKYNLAATGIDFTGGLAVLQVGHNFYAFTREITNHTAGISTFYYPPDIALGYFSQPWDDDHYYIMGMGGSRVILETLDAPGEWLVDKAASKIYLYTPDGTSPTNYTVRVKQRNYGFYASGLSFIEIKGIDFFGCMARLKNSNNSKYEDCDFQYPTFWIDMRPASGKNTWQDECVSITGTNALIRNCRSSYSFNAGLVVGSEWNKVGDGSLIENCYVDNASWYGDHNCPGIGLFPISWNGPCSNLTARNNTVRNVGAIGIFYNAINSLVEYNEVDKACLLGFQDSTAIYTVGVASNSVVRYNWVHDIMPYGSGWWGYGVAFRVDDSGAPIDLYNNVMWNIGGQGMEMKGNLHRIYNNTLIDVGSKSTGSSGSGWLGMAVPGNASSKLYNNFTKKICNSWTVTPFTASPYVGNNWTNNNPAIQFEDVVNRDFRPVSGSGLVDAGTNLTGYTDGYIGSAPDIGAYERGKPYWVPGFRDSVVIGLSPSDNSVVTTNKDMLIWWPVYQATTQSVYFSTDPGNTNLLGNLSGTNVSINISGLQVGTHYYWRVDSVVSGQTVTGSIQSFTVQLSPILTVISGTGSGLYTNGQQVAISADAPAGTAFYQWTGDTQYVNNVAYTNALVTMSTNPVTLTATYYYALTVNSGTGDGFYTNAQVVAISADAPEAGKTFDQWIGDTQVVNNVTCTNALVTLSTNPVTLTATYKILPGWYTLTVNSGTGDGLYTNTQVVAIEADAPASGKAFSRWTGDTQVVNNVTYTNAVVTMSTNAVSLTATYVDVYYVLMVNSGTGDGSYTNGTKVPISADAPASGMAFDQWVGDTQVVASVTASNTTVTMPTRAIALTATYTVATYMLTVNNGTGSGLYTNGALVPITAITPEGTAFARWTGDTQYVNNVTYTNAQVAMSTNPVTLTATYTYIYYTLTGSAGANGTVSPASTNVPVGSSADFVITASNNYRIASLTTNGTDVTGMSFSNGSTSASFTWNNVQYAGTLAATFTAQVSTPSNIIVQWGKSGGDTNIVTATTVNNGSGKLPTNFVAGVQRNNAVGANGYSTVSPYYNGASSLAGGLENVIVNNVGGDYIRNRNSMAAGSNLSAMVVWEQSRGFVNSGLTVTNFAISLFVQHTNNTGSLNWLVEKGGTYYISSQSVNLSGAISGTSWTNASVDASTLTWNTFTPFSSGVATIGSATNITLADVTSLGYYFDVKNNDVAAQQTGVGTRFFSAGGSAGTVGYHTLTVNNGTGGGSYTNGAQVAISAGALTIGKTFDRWIGDTQYVDSVTSSNATVTMPVHAVALTATYKDLVYALTGNVTGGNGTVTPSSTNVVYGSNADFVVTASNYYRIATLETNGSAVTGISFDNSSTTTNFTWSNVQAAGTLAATFTVQVVTNAANTPYEWLVGYGLTNYEADATNDVDLDGLATWQEYVAGTDPTNKASCLRVTENPRNVVGWNAISGRLYNVYWTTNLMNGFQPLETNIPWTRGSFTNQTTVPRGFYKIDVRMAL